MSIKEKSYKQAIFNWSGGKDSALCLHNILSSSSYRVFCLLTTLGEKTKRISMHGVRDTLLEAQAKSIGLPLTKVFIPDFPSMDIYEQTLSHYLIELQQKGVICSVHGDIYLQDLRTYKEELSSKLGLNVIFPLWNRSTTTLAQNFIHLGFKAMTTCVNERYLDQSFVGQEFDQHFLNHLPSNIDPCGENGEFHTFVYDGPYFQSPIHFQKGEIVYKQYGTKNTKNDINSPFNYGFWFCDLL